MKLKIDQPGRHLDQWYERCTQDHEDVKHILDNLRISLSGKYAAKTHYKQITEICLAILALDARICLLEGMPCDPERTVATVGIPDAQLALFDLPSGPSRPDPRP